MKKIVLEERKPQGKMKAKKKKSNLTTSTFLIASCPAT